MHAFMIEVFIELFIEHVHDCSCIDDLRFKCACFAQQDGWLCDVSGRVGLTQRGSHLPGAACAVVAHVIH